LTSFDDTDCDSRILCQSGCYDEAGCAAADDYIVIRLGEELIE